MAKKQVNILLEPEQIGLIQKLSKQTGIKFASCVRMILSDYLKVFKLNQSQNG